MTEFAALIRFTRLLALPVAHCAGSVGIYALVCSSLHPHPDAAVFAIGALGVATGIVLAVPKEGR